MDNNFNAEPRVVEEKRMSNSDQARAIAASKRKQNFMFTVVGVILGSLSIQAFICMIDNSILLGGLLGYMSIAIFPIISAILTLLIYHKNKSYKFRVVMGISLITFVVSPLILWVVMSVFGIIMDLGEYGLMFYFFAGLIPATQIVVVNLVLFYPAILIGYIVRSILNKKPQRT